MASNSKNAYLEKTLIADFIRRGLTIYRNVEVGHKSAISLEQSPHNRELFAIIIQNASFSDEGMYFTEFETENSKYTSDLVNLYVNSIGPIMVEVIFFTVVVLSFLTMFCIVHNVRLWRTYGGFCRQNYPKSSKSSEISFLRKSYDDVILCSTYKSPYMPVATLSCKNLPSKVQDI
ncbi:Oidioi.mRNA.OKI2018_I69.XSR.g14329.t1.cds [Oikopleura dioica]|uniref:Oidioi.mRNA.OKI2018_I69.XSR.g14329.t1.cds n=1 Tax=Oikopleura dioica TaxID=34765 RepID=A0ABN7SDE4_OIKDI|nr:Oidioi.mRNA.OKI2018_I69.XSR.g14329.t1.cds [Oikopleura dioica]